MKNKAASLFILVASTAVIVCPAFSEEANKPMAISAKEMKFAQFPHMPTCTTGAVVNGDPGKGPSIISVKVASGCIIPWHWHNANEHLMMVSGEAELGMKDAKAQKLRAGGFALMPSHHQHKYRCLSSCTMYVYSDAVYDIHYVDKDGKEITSDEALKAVKEHAPAERKAQS